MTWLTNYAGNTTKLQLASVGNCLFEHDVTPLFDDVALEGHQSSPGKAIIAITIISAALAVARLVRTITFAVSSAPIPNWRQLTRVWYTSTADFRK